MKLATLKDGSRDGALVVVSRDLNSYVPVPAIAPTLQAALDEWVSTPFLHFGDKIRLEMLDTEGHSIFAAIEQVVKQYEATT